MKEKNVLMENVALNNIVIENDNVNIMEDIVVNINFDFDFVTENIVTNVVVKMNKLTDQK